MSIDYLIGKTNLQFDRDAINRLEAISELSEKNKDFIINMIDMALRDFKIKQAYK